MALWPRPVARSAVSLVCALAAAACGSSGSAPGTSPTPPAPQAAAWADEFDGAADSAPDPAKWTYDLGGGGWGNQELETYTSASDNVRLDGQGHLVIRVLAAGGTYTSARLETQGGVTAPFRHL